MTERAANPAGTGPNMNCRLETLPGWQPVVAGVLVARADAAYELAVIADEEAEGLHSAMTAVLAAP